MSSSLHIADERGRWAVSAANASVGLSQRRLGVPGISWLAMLKDLEFNSQLDG